MYFNKREEFINELYFTWIDDVEFRFKLAECVRESKNKRRESYTQKEVNDIVGIPLTKIKQIEKGTCKDFNAINNYINFLDSSL